MAHWIWLHLLSFGPGFKSQVHYHLANRVYIEMGKLQCESFGKNLILRNWKLFYVFSKIWNPLWRKTYAIRPIFNVVNGQILDQ